MFPMFPSLSPPPFRFKLADLFFFFLPRMKIVRRDKSNRERKKRNGGRVKLDGSRASSLLGKFDRSSEKGDRKKFSNRCTSFSSLEE